MIDAEGPVGCELIYVRIRQIWGLSQAYPAIKKKFDAHIDALRSEDRILEDGKIFWAVGCEMRPRRRSKRFREIYSSDLERSPPKWKPVRRKRARQNKGLEPFPIATRSGTALVPAIELRAAIVQRLLVDSGSIDEITAAVCEMIGYEATILALKMRIHRCMEALYLNGNVIAIR